jgi:hypothetical protein
VECQTVLVLGRNGGLSCLYQAIEIELLHIGLGFDFLALLNENKYLLTDCLLFIINNYETDHNKTNQYAVINCTQFVTLPMPVKMSSEVWVCSDLCAGNVDSNPSWGIAPLFYEP